MGKNPISFYLKQKRKFVKFFERNSDVTFDDFFGISDFLLKLISFDFRSVSDCASASEKIRLIGRHIMYFFMLLNLYIFCLMIQLKAFDPTSEMRGVSYGITDCLASNNLAIFLISFFIKKQKVVKIMENLRQSYPTRNKLLKQHFVKFHKVSFYIVAFNCCFCIVALVFVPFIAYIFFGVKTLLAPFPAIFYRSEIFPFALIWLAFSVTTGWTQILALNLTCFTLMKMISLEFLKIADKIRQLRHRDEEEIAELLPQLVEKHNGAIKLAKELDEIYSFISLIRFIIGG